MFSWLGRIVMACWRPVSQYARMNKDSNGNSNNSSHNTDDNDDASVLADPLLWCKDLEKHFYGELSYAIVQANEVIEDHSQVETGQMATFVGVYDGHGGPEASRFIRDHLFLHLMSKASSSLDFDTISSTVSVLKKNSRYVQRRI